MRVTSQQLNSDLDEMLKKTRPRITKALLKRIAGYLIPYWPKLLLVTTAILAAAVLELLPSILTGRMIDEGLIGGNFTLLIQLIAASLGILLLSSLVKLLQTWLNAVVSQSITRDMRNQMYGHLQKMSHNFFTASKPGDVTTRMTNDIDGVESVLTGTLTNSISNLAVLLTSIIAMYQKNWILASAGILILPVLVLPVKAVGRRRWSLTLQSRKHNDEINQILNETLSVSGQQLTKLYTNEDYEYQKYTAANNSMFKLNVKENTAGRWFRMSIGMITNLGPMLIYLVGGILILRVGYTGLTVGDITVMVALLNRMYRPLSQLMEIQVDFIRALALFTRIFEYLDLPVEIKNKVGAVAPKTVKGQLSFEKVCFHYKEGSPVLKDVTFTVEAGQTVAIVGPSGSGKSTLTNLAVRLYDVISGSVTLDGIDVRDWDIKALRQNIGIVTQDSYLFNGTVHDNLLYARSNASQKEIEKACQEANIHDFIASLPDGYETIVGNRGVKLSGGEKQRLSIARAILKNPKLLILDEATSSLDSISEHMIQQAIEPLMGGRTSLVIAHRLSTIMAADRILVIKNGQIAEQGTHTSLLQENGIYKELYETQFAKVLHQDRQHC